MADGEEELAIVAASSQVLKPVAIIFRLRKRRNSGRRGGRNGGLDVPVVRCVRARRKDSQLALEMLRLEDEDGGGCRLCGLIIVKFGYILHGAQTTSFEVE